MNFEIYPLLFEPNFIDVIWGGNKIASYIDYETPATAYPIGESWLICDRENKQSIVRNGSLAGHTLNELVKLSPKNLVGSSHQENQPFPLLIKIIDSAERLSLQVHPDQFTAVKYPGAETKSEMCYIIENEPNAIIYAGLRFDKTQQYFRSRVGTDNLEECLQIFQSQAGDAFWIPAGTVHAIGGGNLILEIQQNSDTTFRVHDWGRKDKNGNSRQLHIEEALACIQFKDRSLPLIKADQGAVSANKKRTLVRSNKFFYSEELKIVNEFFSKTTTKSFHILSAVNNSFVLKYNEGEIEIPRGHSCLLPAALGDYQIVYQPNVILTVVRSMLSM